MEQTAEHLMEVMRKCLEDIRAYQNCEPLPSGGDDVSDAYNDLADAFEALDKIGSGN